MSEKKFVHFGCWNNLNTGKNEKMLGNMKNVMTALSKHPKPDFLVIAGDNYYPEKVKPVLKEPKKKYIYKNRLIEGFDTLPKNIEINMILGNHDLETNGDDIKTLFVKAEDGHEELESNCLIIKEEMKFDKLKLVLNEKKRIGNTLLIMIDTSMYSDEADVKDFMPCYNIFLKENMDTKTLIRRQENFIEKCIQDNKTVENIIIIGHHPIIYIKVKESKSKESKKETEKSPKVLNDIPAFINVLKMIKRTADKNTQFHYLCADLHLFQKGVVTIDKGHSSEMIVNQYIVGTGGTELDEGILDQHLNKDYHIDSVSYHVSECKKAFGFLECIIKETGPEFHFYNLKNSKQSKSNGGSKRRRTRKKILKN